MVVNMWISKEEYNILKSQANELEDLKIAYLNDIDIYRIKIDMANHKCFKTSTELYNIKKDLEHYLNTNEELGVVYIPKFVVEKLVYGIGGNNT